MSYATRIQEVDDKFQSFGFKPIDIQMDEPNVGISEGWVLYNDNDIIRDICWVDAEYHKDKESILKNSTIFED